jgi:hypothetical protein
MVYGVLCMVGVWFFRAVDPDPIGVDPMCVDPMCVDPMCVDPMCVDPMVVLSDGRFIRWPSTIAMFRRPVGA